MFPGSTCILPYVGFIKSSTLQCVLPVSKGLTIEMMIEGLIIFVSRLLKPFRDGKL